MKIGLDNKIHLHRSSLSSSGAKSPEGGILKSAIPAQIMREDSNYKINTTASKNTRGRMSFKGVDKTIIKEAEELSKTIGEELEKTVKVTPKMVTLAKKLENSPKIKKALDFIGDNSLLSEALFAVLITCGLRPAIIVASPGKGENKEKNQYAAAHSVASGIIGLVSTILVSQPIKKAINSIAKKEQFGGISIGITKEIKKQKLLEVAATKNVLERIHNIVFLPLRASVTIALIPIILGAFGIKKVSKSKEKDASSTNKTQILIPTNTKKVFQSFAGVR